MTTTCCGWIAALALGAAGCDLMYDPDVGPLQDDPTAPDGGSGAPATGACVDGDPATPVLFSTQVRPVLARSPGGCTGCHGTSAISGFNLTSYESLRGGGQVSGDGIVVAGSPCDSVLYQKLGPAPPFGARMPYNGPPFFSADDLALLRDWIAEGALNN
jgi:hypothetical protein